MMPHDHAQQVMLPHLIGWMTRDKDYAAQAVRDYLALCPWAEPLIGQQLREAWRTTSPESIPPGYGMSTNVAKVKK